MLTVGSGVAFWAGCETNRYLPSEVARMAGVSTAMVDDRLYRARREVKLFVHDPGQLAFIASDGATRTRSSWVLDDADGSEDGLVRHLRAMIFNERHVTCWPKRALRELYREQRREAPARRGNVGTGRVRPARGPLLQPKARPWMRGPVSRASWNYR
jgi:hypothetical protein